MSLVLAVMVAEAAATEAAPADGPVWLGIVGLAGLVGIFALFGYSIWRAVDPARWAPPCEQCGLAGKHDPSCPRRSSGSGRRRRGGVAEAIFWGVVEGILSGGD